MKKSVSRRNFLGLMSAGAASVQVNATHLHPRGSIMSFTDRAKPALLGGEPVRNKPFPSWPVIEDNERRTWEAVLEKGRWNRGPYVERFESQWAAQLGCPYSVATSSGTAALHTSLYALDVGPGDEVILPPYTFVATVNVVLLHHALPIFVDSDRQTFQIDYRKIEEAVNERTRCLMPVHLGGNPAHLDHILEIGVRHGIPVLEDACQAHLAEWKNRKVGTVGDLGCFSFQASKNLNSGEGGSIASREGELIAKCASFQNAGRGYAIDAQGRLTGDRSSGFVYARLGDNRRITEFQGALLLEQLTRLEEQASRREENAGYLTAHFREIEGIRPAEMYEGATRNAYHLYMFRYDPEAFSGLSRSRFMEALEAEGIPCSGGYGRLNEEPFIRNTLRSRAFKNIYGEKRIEEVLERSHCPENNRLCEEAVWFTQTRLLGPREDMDQIAEAVRKIQKHSGELARG